jgi:hypothetical protein
MTLNDWISWDLHTRLVGAGIILFFGLLIWLFGSREEKR